MSSFAFGFSRGSGPFPSLFLHVRLRGVKLCFWFFQGFRPVSKSFPPRRRTPSRGAMGTATDTGPNTLAGNRGGQCLGRGGSRGAKAQRRATRHPARAASADLARSWTAATDAALAAPLGVSRAESVPNLTRPYAAWSATDARVREQLVGLEELDESGASGITCRDTDVKDRRTRLFSAARYGPAFPGGGPGSSS